MTDKERTQKENADALCDRLGIPRFADAAPPAVVDAKLPVPVAERRGWFVNWRWND